MRVGSTGGHVVGLDTIDGTQAATVGGKGARLGELLRVEGVDVPPGFCVTTDAFTRVMAQAVSIDDRLDQLSLLSPDDRDGIATRSAAIREAIERIAVPDEVAASIERAIVGLGERSAYAVRSSATAEDLPDASFAGQHDTFLNVVGTAAVLRHVRRCWASLFTERAVSYRLRNGIDQRRVQMAVVVQHMVVPAAAGVLFTADPVTSNRNIACVEAIPGVGDALVAGRVNADVFHVRDGAVISVVRRGPPSLTDAQAVRLAQLGRRIEAHLGEPQDIEWCVADDRFVIVQSRPITTLFPLPEIADGAHHVFISVGHQQMMTDPMKPLGLSVWQLTALRPMYVAGGRLFVDVTAELASPARRASLLDMAGRSDPLIKDALLRLVDRGDVPPSPPGDRSDPRPAGRPPESVTIDPALVAELIERSRTSLAALQRDIRTRSGPELLDFILADLDELRRLLSDPHSHQVVMAGIEATWWLDGHLRAWLGEKDAVDTLTRSVPGNVTSEMGLALLDVADAIRPHREVVERLPALDDDGFLDHVATLSGGRQASRAIRAFLDAYGMRGPGEIDITRPRWSERPTTLVPMILGNIANFEPGEATRRFERGRQAASAKEREVLDRLRRSPDGAARAEVAQQMIERIRTFIGYREYPKYTMISRYFVYKQALLAEAERLVRADVLAEVEDIFFLTFEELHDVVRTHHVDDQLIQSRQRAFTSFHALTPPRVLTSEGEVIAGSYRRDDLPAGALVGLAVSAGTIEGRARVILDLAEADLETGDILVTRHTDPSWSPLFLTVGGLVTEVGGLMTHGAVIAREYGVPAVVGVEHATKLIVDGQRIRVHGTDGYVEMVDHA